MQMERDTEQDISVVEDNTSQDVDDQNYPSKIINSLKAELEKKDKTIRQKIDSNNALFKQLQDINQQFYQREIFFNKILSLTPRVKWKRVFEASANTDAIFCRQKWGHFCRQKLVGDVRIYFRYQ